MIFEFDFPTLERVGHPVLEAEALGSCGGGTASSAIGQLQMALLVDFG